MFEDNFSFGAVTTDFGFGIPTEFTVELEPAIDFSLGQIDVTFPSIFDVIELNAAPVATNDTATTEQGASVTINVLENDFDPDRDTISLLAAGDAANGTCLLYTSPSPRDRQKSRMPSSA